MEGRRKVLGAPRTKLANGWRGISVAAVNSMRLFVEPLQTRGDITTVSGVLEGAGAPQRLWWKVPARWADALDTSADPFVVAFMMPLMQQGGVVHIQGRVSPSLLASLDRYAAIWRTWAPSRYKTVVFTADEEAEAPPPASDAFVLPLSCGVDSCYTLWRQLSAAAGRRTRRPGAVVLMHGFDILLDQPHSDALFAGVERAARAMVSGLNLPVITVRTNFRELRMLWAHSFGTELGAGFRLFSRQFAGALIPNNIPYGHLEFVWGSHPLIDRELSSRHFTVEDEGGEATRFEKLALLKEWPEALANLRVCFGVGASSSENCGVCEKCVRTILACRLAGMPLPGAFRRDISEADLRRIKVHSGAALPLWAELYEGAVARGLDKTSWGRALRKVYHRGRRRKVLERLKSPFLPLRNALRYIFRGTTLSRRELALQRSAASKVS